MFRAFILIFLVSILSLSFTKKEKKECLKTFEWVVKTFEENDAGAPMIIASKGEENYQQFTESTRKKIKEIKNEEEFLEIVNEWLRYFRKEHHYFYIKEESWLESLNNSSVEKNPSHFEKLSDKTGYLYISSALIQYKAELDEILEENKEIILSTPNLIIDIRYSGGGSTNTFRNIEPYLYTNPKTYSENGEIRVTELNIKAFEFTSQKAKGLNNKDLEQFADKIVQGLKEETSDFYTMYHTKEEILLPVTNYPQKVAILCGQGTGSADEEFLLSAKQSYKVKIFGRPTAGCVDDGNLFFAHSPDNKYELIYATTRSTRSVLLPLNNVGIQPDFLITDDVPESEWVEYVQKILEYGQ